MEENANRLPKRVIWGVGASVLLHVIFLLGVLLYWPIAPRNASKEEVVNVSIEQPPEEKPKNEAEKQPEPPPKPPEKPPEARDRPIETYPPPPPEHAAFESAPKDEQAPKQDDVPAPPPSEQAAEEQAKQNTAQKQGEDKPVSGDPAKQEPPKEAAVLKDIAPPDIGPNARPKVADKAEQAGGGIVTEQKFDLSEGAEQGPPTASVPTPAPKPTSQTPVPDLKPAKRIYSKDALSDPRVKAALGTLPAKDRTVQICGTEMIEQIRHSLPGSAPESLAKAVTTKEQIDSNVMAITNAVYRSRGQWYSVSLHCETDAKAINITSFKSTVSTPIPRSEWGAMGLRAN